MPRSYEARFLFIVLFHTAIQVVTYSRSAVTCCLTSISVIDITQETPTKKAQIQALENSKGFPWILQCLQFSPFNWSLPCVNNDSNNDRHRPYPTCPSGLEALCMLTNLTDQTYLVFWAFTGPKGNLGRLLAKFAGDLIPHTAEEKLCEISLDSFCVDVI